MASIDRMNSYMNNLKSKHERTAEKLAALKAQFMKEEKILKNQEEKIYTEWAKKVASLAANENIQIDLIDAKQLVELVKEHKDILIKDVTAATVSSKDNVQPAFSRAAEAGTSSDRSIL